MTFFADSKQLMNMPLEFKMVTLGNLILEIFYILIYKFNNFTAGGADHVIMMRVVYLSFISNSPITYIHFSNKDQVKTTLVKYFSKKKNLILLKINTLKLNNLIWEQSSDGNLFPHLYSDLELSNVSCEYDIVLNKDGTYRLPLEY